MFKRAKNMASQLQLASLTSQMKKKNELLGPNNTHSFDSVQCYRCQRLGQYQAPVLLCANSIKCTDFKK